MALSLSPYSTRQCKPFTGMRCLRPGLRLLMCRMVFACLLLTAPPFLRISLGADSPQVAQDQIKAVYLYNFLQFVTWPTSPSQTDQDTSKLICLINDIDINNALEELHTTLAQKIKNPFRIKHYEKYQAGMDFTACHILFVSATEENYFGEIINSLQRSPTLTISDKHDFEQVGGMIFLTNDQNRLRYHINRKATTAAGLRLSSQLLKSAIEVTDE